MRFIGHAIRTRWNHFWSAKGRHGTHSPLVYGLLDVDLKIALPAEIQQIENFRQQLMQSKETWEPLDYGAGSRGQIRSLGDAVRNASSDPQKGAFLYRWVKRFKPNHILELGTNVGISAAYMLLADAQSSLTTIEGDPFLIEKSKEILSQNQDRVQVIQGNFDVVLSEILPQKKWDLVVIDGNHRGEALLKYFYQILPYLSAEAWVIMDDIHWSPDMTLAWEKIVKDEQLMLTLEFYQMGIYGHGPRFQKEKFILSL